MACRNLIACVCKSNQIDGSVAKNEGVDQNQLTGVDIANLFLTAIIYLPLKGDGGTTITINIPIGRLPNKNLLSSPPALPLLHMKVCSVHSQQLTGAGDVEELPEGTAEYNPNIMRIRPTSQEEEDLPALRQIGEASTSGQPPSEGQGHNSTQLHSGPLRL